MLKKNNKLCDFCLRKAGLSKSGPREVTTQAGFLAHQVGQGHYTTLELAIASGNRKPDWIGALEARVSAPLG